MIDKNHIIKQGYFSLAMLGVAILIGFYDQHISLFLTIFASINCFLWLFNRYLDIKRLRQNEERSCENCGEKLNKDEDEWCDNCILPERNIR